MGYTLLPTNLLPYETFILPENFRLSWERVRYFDRPDSRDWIGLKVFGANRDYNLEALRQSIINRTFEPTYPEIKYIPKVSLTLRPMAILAVSDRIVYQAIANVIAEKGRSTLAMISNRQSYANILTDSGEDSFFVHWKKQYKEFQNKFVELINEGNEWLAETDAAAFYETIDHNQLKEILLRNDFLDDKTNGLLMNYLSIWSSIKSGSPTRRGIPQGCLASDLLANVFLCEFDKELASKEYYCLRYVDDVRVMAIRREAVLRGLIHVDMGLKSLSVLLQTKKTTVRKILNVDQEVDRLASLLSDIDQRMREPEPIIPPEIDPLLNPSLHNVALLDENHNLTQNLPETSMQEELIDIFWQAKKSIDLGRDKDDDPFAERHLKFCLYRLEPNTEIAKAILPYLIEKPWLSQVIGLYLGKCTLGIAEINYLKEIITSHNIYENIITTAIEVLLKQNVSLKPQHDLFKQWINEDKLSWSLLCNALIVLGGSSENMSIILKALKSYSSTVRRMAIIQALRLSRNQNEAIHICQIAVSDKSPIVTDTLLYLMYNEHALKVSDINYKDSLTDYCKMIAQGYDTTLPSIEPDYIRHIFSKSYSVIFTSPVDFHGLFGTHFDRAAEFLWQAETSFLVNPSRYVSQLNLFHEELLYPILVDKLKLKKSDNELALTEFGNRVEMLHKHKKELASLAGGIINCNLLRANPETHSRFHNQLIETSHVTPKKRNDLKKRLMGGYQELTDWLIAGCP